MTIWMKAYKFHILFEAISEQANTNLSGITDKTNVLLISNGWENKNKRLLLDALSRFNVLLAASLAASLRL